MYSIAAYLKKINPSRHVSIYVYPAGATDAAANYSMERLRLINHGLQEPSKINQGTSARGAELGLWIKVPLEL